MSPIAKKISLTKYFFIFGLIISLICAITSLYLNNSRLSLKNSFKQYASLENNNAKLDSCIIYLYKAENNCRMFVVTGDKNYFNDLVIFKSLNKNLLNLKF